MIKHRASRYPMDVTRRGAPSFTRMQRMMVLDAFKTLGDQGKFVPLNKLIEATGIDGRTVRAVMRDLTMRQPFPVPLVSLQRGYRLTVSQHEAMQYQARLRRTAQSIIERAEIQGRVAASIPPDSLDWLQPRML